METPDSADVELDFRGFPVTPVQLGIFTTPSARVRQTFPFGKRIQNTDPSFILKDEVCLPLKCVHMGLSQNSQKSKKKKKCDEERFLSKNALISLVAAYCVMQLSDSSLGLDLVMLMKLRIPLGTFLLLILVGFFKKKCV